MEPPRAPLPPPNSPVDAGAADVGVEEVLLVPPKGLPAAGVVEVPPNSAPDVGAGAVFEDEDAPPNRPPAGFCASPAGF